MGFGTTGHHTVPVRLTSHGGGSCSITTVNVPSCCFASWSSLPAVGCLSHASMALPVYTTPVMCRPETRQPTRVHAEVIAGPLPQDLSGLVPIVGASISSLMFLFCHSPSPPEFK